MKLAGLLLAAGLTAALLRAADAPPANLAAFGYLSRVSAEGTTPPLRAPALADVTNRVALRLTPDQHLLIEWQNPRPVRAVALRFAGAAPQAREVRVEWWRSAWPDHGIADGQRLDDPFSGGWVRAFPRSVPAETNEVRLEFGPLGPGELPGVQRTGLTERVTYRLRLSFARPVEVEHLAAHSDAVERTAELRFEWDVHSTVPGEWHPTFEARNGRIREVRKTGAKSAVVTVDYADAPDRLSPDRGHVIFRSGETRSFAVFVDDVWREGGLYVRDIGVFVSDSGRQLTFRGWSGPAGEVWAEGSVAEQVSRLPEQSFAAASAARPPRPRPWLVLGAPNQRQEIVLLPDGDVQLRADALRAPGPDADFVGRPWPELTYDFETGDRPRMGPGGSRQVARALEEGWLPIVHHAWREGEVDCEQSCLAAPLRSDLATLEAENDDGAEPVVLAAQFVFRNASDQPQPLALWLEFSRLEPLRISVDNTLLLSRPSDRRLREGVVPVRGHFNLRGRGRLEVAVLTPSAPGSYQPALARSPSAREAVRYQVELAPGATHAIEFFAPYLELQTPDDLAALKGLSFAELRASVAEFWKQRVTRGMTLDVPEPWLNHLFKANFWRVLINTDTDPVTGLRQYATAPPGPANALAETAMVARALEMRGEHAAAVRLLEPFVVAQGRRGLPGTYRSREAVFHAASPVEPDPYSAEGSALDHGTGMWTLAEHFAWSRDHRYLISVVPRLIGAADWVTQERAATRFSLPDGRRPVEFGLPPAGPLPGVGESQYWYAAAAFLQLGMTHVLNAVGALALHPDTDPALRRVASREATRLDRELKAFTADLRASVAEAVATTPVVRLRDGHYLPCVPPHPYALTDQRQGGLREAIYPALHLAHTGLFEPGHPFVNWMVQTLEDRELLSASSGFEHARPRADFFHHGGTGPRPLALGLPLIYLRQDRVANFLRGFYNAAAASLSPDGIGFTGEGPPSPDGAGPFDHTPDECRFIQWLRQMLILENGDRLELGLGVPRAWMADGQAIRVERATTWFGRLNLEIVSRAAERRVRARVALEPTVVPGAILLRLRDPESRPLRSATVNRQRARVDPVRQTIELPPRAGIWEVEARF